MSSRFNGPLDPETAEIYERIKIAMLTGWTLEYIDTLSMIDYSAILQIHEVEQALQSARPKGGK